MCGHMPACNKICREGALESDPQSCWNHPDYALQTTSDIKWWKGAKGLPCAYTYEPAHSDYLDYVPGKSETIEKEK